MPDNRDLPERSKREDDVPFQLPSEDDSSESGDIVPLRTDPNVITGNFEYVDQPALNAGEDDDVPFKLPKAEDFIDPEALTEKYDNDDTEDIVPVNESQIRAQDVATGDFPAYDPEEDVPFKLPKSDDAPKSDKEERLVNKFVTMPNTPEPEAPRPPNAPTLPGSGGLDPNPDYQVARQPAPTVQNQPRVPAPPADDSRYRRPAQQQYAAPQPYAPAPTMPQARPVPPQGKALPRRPAGSRRRFRPGCLAIFIGVFVTFCGGLTLISLLVGGIAYASIGNLLNDRFAIYDEYEAFQSTFFYDRNGEQLYEIVGEGRRTNVPLSQIPADLINATIATEDDEYYTNIGIDVPATVLAVSRFFGGGGNTDIAGASSITQQVVRNILFPPEYAAERSVGRKAEEIILAIALTGRKPGKEGKDEILELYLNEIYYGNLSYGVQAAARTFFDKDVSELTLGESALLAGLPQAPANLDPLNPDPNIQADVDERWKYVLNEMVEEGYITDDERSAAIAEGLTYNTPRIDLKAPHFTVYARGQLEEILTADGRYTPETIANGGLRVYTTVDLGINDMAQQTVLDQVSRLRASNNVGNGAVVVLKPITGEILAMIGSADYDDDSIDGRVNVMTSFRQPGSTVKALTYAAAIERGMSIGEVIWDTPTRIGISGSEPYEPRNYTRSFHGPMTMRTALANSYNVTAVQTLRHYVGVEYYMDFMQRLGMQTLSDDPSQYGLSITLGGAEVSGLELTNAFATLANGGALVEPQAILCVLNSDDEIIYQYEDSCPRGNPTEETINEYGYGTQVLDPRIAFIISDILSDNNARSIEFGSGSALNTPGIISSVKTGTTDNFKDNWTVGYTRTVAVGVWVGNTRGEAMVDTSGLTGAAPIWNTVITNIYNNNEMLNQFTYGGELPYDDIIAPDGISRQRICDVRRLTDPATTCPQIDEWLLDDPAGVPNEYGELEYPNGTTFPPPEPLSTGEVLYSPGVYQANVYRLNDAVAQAIQFQVEPGKTAPPPPIYCRVPPEMMGSTSGVQTQLFIARPPEGPDDFGDAAAAEQYARRANLAILPGVICTPDIVTGGGAGYRPTTAVASISQPQPGATVTTQGMDIIGTVQFDPAVADFYKFEIRGGNFPNWTTIGDVHSENNIVEGRLEFLPGSPGLAPGDYELKLAIIAKDSQPLQAPVVVPFRVE